MSKENMEFNIHPMDQLLIDPLLMGEKLQWYSFTNQTLWMLISLIAISFVFIFGPRKHQLVPGRFQSIAELIYFFIRDMIVDITGQEGLRYFPYIFTLFVLVLFGNILGLLPYSFTYTSHIAVTGFLALTVFLTVTMIGFIKMALVF